MRCGLRGGGVCRRGGPLGIRGLEGGVGGGGGGGGVVGFGLSPKRIYLV